MTINLNLGRLAKSMSVQDKIKLLLANANTQAETAGKEYVITPAERDAIIADARKNNEITMLNHAFECYRAAWFIHIELTIVYFRHLVMLAYLERHLACCYLKYERDEVVGQIFYDLRQSKTTQDDDDDLSKFMKRYFVKDSLWSSFDYYSEPDDQGLQEPNESIQIAFMELFKITRKLNMKLFELDYIIEKVGFNFLSDSAKSDIATYRTQLHDFIELDNFLKPIRIFRDIDLENIKTEGVTEPEFINTVRDLKNKIAMTDEEKRSCRDSVDSDINDGV